MWPKTAVCRNLFLLQTVNVVYFQRRTQLSGFSGSPSQLIRIIGNLLYITYDIHELLHVSILRILTIARVNYGYKKEQKHTWARWFVQLCRKNSLNMAPQCRNA